jgi:hypothetical protein
MFSKDRLNVIFEKVARNIDISDELFEQAKEKYEDMGKWLDSETPEYKIDIYTQGSFALGTVIKPLSDKDEYDLDLVCEFKNAVDSSAKELKIDIVKPLLQSYGDCDEPKEKKRCWQITYKDSPQFHMDIIPALTGGTHILITDKNEKIEKYDYIGSNPGGYIEWFKERMKARLTILKEQFALREFNAKIDDVPDYKVKTPLQRAIQILKRHRDIMFLNDKDNVKPISIIITTVSANIYNNEDNIYDTLKSILEKAEKHINDCKVDGKYYILNPTITGKNKENFADKWNEHPERADAFFEWVNKAKEDFIVNPLAFATESEVGNILKFTLGESVVEKSMFEIDRDMPAKMNAILEENNAIIPYRVNSLLSVLHRQRPIWSVPKGYSVLVKASVRNPDGSEYFYRSDGHAIKKNALIDFTAVTGIKKPYKVYWQVVNTGQEAIRKNCLRGGFELSDIGMNTRREATSYTGSHFVQCFVIKNGQCVGKSKEFIVNIE